eukprot:Nk52_evm21s292 gene=Nk52_evmTU21s292
MEEERRRVEIRNIVTCPLCTGIIITATTITECLHTFCHSCIVQFLENSSSSMCSCPVCSTMLVGNPFNLIRIDEMKQVVINNLVPGLVANERKRIEEFQRLQKGSDAGDAGTESESGARREGEVAGGDSGGNLQKEYAKEREIEEDYQMGLSTNGTETDQQQILVKDVCQFILKQHSKKNGKGADKQLIRPFILTTMSATLFEVRKYLAEKLGMPEDYDLSKIELFVTTTSGKRYLPGNEHEMRYVFRQLADQRSFDQLNKSYLTIHYSV